MKTVTMLEFRQNAENIIRRAQSGQRITLTYRGKPVVRLEPIRDEPSEDDPFYRLADLADDHGESLSNAEIDEIVYGS